MDNDNLTKYSPTMKGKYVVIDTQMEGDRCAYVKAMNGRQGVDNIRQIPIAIVDGTVPHDLSGETVLLAGQDADGVVKYSNVVVNVVSAAGGLVIIGVPAAFYQAVGDYQHAYLVIAKDVKDGDDLGALTNAQIVSTVNIAFTVLENGLVVTSGQSELYLGEISKTLEKANAMFPALQNALYADRNAASEISQLIKEHQVATLIGDNHFTGANQFDQTTAFDRLTANSANIGQLGGSAIDQIKSLIAQNAPAGVDEAKVSSMIASAIGNIKTGGSQHVEVIHAGNMTGINGFSTSGFDITGYRLGDNAVLYACEGEFTSTPNMAAYSSPVNCLQMPAGLVGGQSHTLTNEFYAVNNKRVLWIKYCGNNQWQCFVQGGDLTGESEGGIMICWLSVQ